MFYLLLIKKDLNKMTVTKEQDTKNEFLNYLKNEGAYVNKIKTKNTENNVVVIDDNNNNDIEYGLYVTSDFFNTKKSFENTMNIYEEKVPEAEATTDKLGRTISKKLNFNDTFLNSITTTANNIFCQFFLPLIFKIDDNISNIFLLNFNIKKIPFDIQFQFTSTNNKSAITPLINNKAYDQYENLTQDFFETYQTDFYKGAYDLKLYQIYNKKTKYSDIISGIIINENIEITINTDIDIVSNLKIKIDNDKNLVINNASDNQIVFSIINEIERNNKYITYTDNVNVKAQKPDTLDQNVQKLYFHDKCITPEIQTEAVVSMADYYDINFECRKLPAFINSNWMPGFHVIKYLPTQLFGTTFTLPANNSHSISLNEVYMSLFKNKIIELTQENVNP